MIKNCFINGSKKVITPWGVFEQFCLNKKVTVKILTIKKNQEISLQKHSKRNEFWRIISGKGQIIIGNSKKIICHCCNDLGAMGSGVARALFLKWPNVRSEYVNFFKKQENNNLGDVQYINVEKDIVVCNMIGQHDIVKNQDGGPPVRYWAIRQAFESIRNYFKNNDYDIHIPYLMGCDLARGRWEEVEKIIEDCFSKHDVQVYVYDLFSKRENSDHLVKNKDLDDLVIDIDDIF